MSTNQPEKKDVINKADADTTADRPVDPVDQTLVAYLDGELTDAEIDKVEADLVADSGLRTRLHELQATWDMLDELPREEPGESFLKSTIELVVTSAQRKKRKWHRWPLRIGALAIAFGLTFAVAFQVVRYMQAAPYRQFVSDLDFLENADLYQQVQDVEFLTRLHKAGVFRQSSETVDVSIFELPNEERLASLDPFEIQDIRQDEKTFHLMSTQEKKKLRDIHREIFASDQRDELLATLRLYCQWYAKVPPSEEKYALKQLSVDERVQKVIEIRKREAEVLFGLQGETSLPQEDVPALFKWGSDFCKAKNEAMINALVGDSAQSLRNPIRERNFTPEQIFLFLRFSKPDAAIALIDAEDIEKLRNALSPEAVTSLDTLAPGESPEARLLARKTLVDRWLTSAVEARNNPEVDDATLIDFLETEMDEEKKRLLDGLSPSEAREYTRQLYLEHRDARARENGEPFVFPGRWSRDRGRRGRGGRNSRFRKRNSEKEPRD